MTIRKLILLLLIACTATTTARAEGDLDSLYAQSLLHNGMEAPDFLIDSLSNTRLKDMRGRYVVLHFWATWCPDCRKDMPEMERLFEEYSSDSVVFIHISFDTEKEKWQQYLSENIVGGLQLTELKRMKDSQLAKAYGIQWIPTMYVLNTEGKVILSTVMIEKLRKRLSRLDLSRVRVPRARVSRLPSFPGGDQAMMLFLVRNVEYPRTASNYGLEGQTLLDFTVNVDGTISDVKVKSNVITVEDKLPFQRLAGDEKRKVKEKVLEMFAEEGIRVISLMPKWKPGVRFGIPFKARYELPINFRINYNNRLP